MIDTTVATMNGASSLGACRAVKYDPVHPRVYPGASAGEMSDLRKPFSGIPDRLKDNNRSGMDSA